MPQALALTIGHGTHAVQIAPRTVLAPMDGITDGVFRGLVAQLPGLGAVVTEFARISAQPLPAKLLSRTMGPRAAIPTALQLMAADEQHVGETAAQAQGLGAAWVDLNFGCPVKRVYNKCAGSALLAYPERMAAIIRAACAGTALPVTAKIRAGIGSPSHLHEILDACAQAGAQAITLHARLRCMGYHEAAEWSWISSAVEYLRRQHPQVPLIGNGGVDRPQQIAHMREQTGCAAVMVGQAALANPWIFAEAAGLPAANAVAAGAWLKAYARALEQAGGAHAALGKLKQAVKRWRAANLFTDPDRRQELLRCEQLEQALALIAAAVSLLGGDLAAQ